MVDVEPVFALVDRANVLLSPGQFSEAARIYSEAIGSLSALLSCISFKINRQNADQSPGLFVIL